MEEEREEMEGQTEQDVMKKCRSFEMMGREKPGAKEGRNRGTAVCRGW